MDDELKGFSRDVVNGSTPRPKAEEAPGHAGTAGEVSPEALGKSGDDTAFVLTRENPLSSSTLEPWVITRATMRFTVEPWRLAQDPEAHAKRTCATDCGACALIRTLYRAQTTVASAMNLIGRRIYLRDAEALDKFRLEHGRAPKGKELEFANHKGGDSGYQQIRAAFPGLASGIASTIAREVVVKWMKDRWNVLVRCEKAPAFYRDSAPIPLRAPDVRLVETGTRNAFELEFSLSSGRIGKGKEFVLPIRSKDARQYRALHGIASGADRMGQVEIMRDPRSDKWFLRVAYKHRVERTMDGKAAAINRGITCILACITEDGESTIEDGVAIEKHLAQVTRRRQEFQRAWRLSSRKGQGRAKTLAPLKAMEKKGKLWRENRLQEIARQTAKWIATRGVSRVYFDDFKDIRMDPKLFENERPIWERIQRWPYFQMGTRLKSCLQEYGIEVFEVDPTRNTITCPECAYVQARPVISRRWKCPQCSYKGHTDLVFCRNSLVKGERLRAEQLARGETPGNDTASTTEDVAARKSRRKGRKGKGFQGGGRKQ